MHRLVRSPWATTARDIYLLRPTTPTQSRRQYTLCKINTDVVEVARPARVVSPQTTKDRRSFNHPLRHADSDNHVLPSNHHRPLTTTSAFHSESGGMGLYISSVLHPPSDESPEAAAQSSSVSMSELKEGELVGSLDCGTTSVRFIVFDSHAAIVAQSQLEFPQYYPHPGWHEHDPVEIQQVSEECIVRACEQLEQNGWARSSIKVIGVFHTVLLVKFPPA